MATTDAQKLSVLECWCGARREGRGPEAAFIAQAQDDGWEEIQHQTWVCPDCADDPMSWPTSTVHA